MPTRFDIEAQITCKRCSVHSNPHPNPTNASILTGSIQVSPRLASAECCSQRSDRFSLSRAGCSFSLRLGTSVYSQTRANRALFSATLESMCLQTEDERLEQISKGSRPTVRLSMTWHDMLSDRGRSRTSSSLAMHFIQQHRYSGL
jgi:hypothetical protein